MQGRLCGKLITNVSDLYIPNINLRGRLCYELITANIDESPTKEELRVANPIMGIVRTRLRSRRGALSDFLFGSSDGSNYEDAVR